MLVEEFRGLIIFVVMVLLESMGKGIELGSLFFCELIIVFAVDNARVDRGGDF